MEAIESTSSLVFDCRFDEKGYHKRFKSRLVAQGLWQLPLDLVYFVATLFTAMSRLLCAICCIEVYEKRQYGLTTQEKKTTSTATQGVSVVMPC